MIRSQQNKVREDLLSNEPPDKRPVFNPGKVVVIFNLSKAGSKESTCVLPLNPVIAMSTSMVMLSPKNEACRRKPLTGPANEIAERLQPLGAVWLENEVISGRRGSQ